MSSKDTIEISWHVDDVLEVRPHLSRDQAREVLQAVKQNHDANNGVTWETLEAQADSLFPLEDDDDIDTTGRGLDSYGSIY